MTIAENTNLPGVDASRPNFARVYDFFLDWDEQFPADRELAANRPELAAHLGGRRARR